MPKLSLDSLIRDGRITRETYDAALRRSGEIQMSVEYVLRTEHGIPPEAIGAALAAHYRTEFVPYRDDLKPLSEAGGLNPDQCRFHRYVAIGRERGRLVVLMADPGNLPVRDSLEAVVGAPIVVKVAFVEDIVRILTGEEPAPRVRLQVPPSAEEVDLPPEEEVGLGGEIDLDESPVVKLCNVMLVQAVRGGAEELRLDPRDPLPVRARVGGIWKGLMDLPVDFMPRLINRLKVMAGLDPCNRAKAQEGRFQVMMQPRNLQFRISTEPLGDGVEAASLHVVS